MKITIITSNKMRHNYLINSLQEIANVNIIQESTTLFKGANEGKYPVNRYIRYYFEKVKHSEKKFFNQHRFISSYKKNKILNLCYGDLNKININDYPDFFKSDLYVVFGSSFIKGKLLDFLVKKGAINIHMGISPYYTGTDCNFWAIYDNNINLVGATVHYLTKNLDIGPILYHACSEIVPNPFDYSMSTVKSAILSLKEKIISKEIFNKAIYNSEFNLNQNVIRNSKKKNFTPYISKKFINQNVSLKKKYPSYDLIRPYILKKNKFFI